MGYLLGMAASTFGNSNIRSLERKKLHLSKRLERLRNRQKKEDNKLNRCYNREIDRLNMTKQQMMKGVNAEALNESGAKLSLTELTNFTAWNDTEKAKEYNKFLQVKNDITNGIDLMYTNEKQRIEDLKTYEQEKLEDKYTRKDEELESELQYINDMLEIKKKTVEVADNMKKSSNLMKNQA